MKIGIITFEDYENRAPGTIGSSRIRGSWVAKHNDQIEMFEPGQHYDAVVYQKAYWKEHIRDFKGVKIFDMCDPDWLDGRPVAEMLQYADAVTTSTETLAKFLRKMSKTPVQCIPDRIDPEVHVPQKSVYNERIRSAVWFGYAHNSWILDSVVEVLRQQKIQLAVIADRPYMEADAQIKYSEETIYEDLIEHDIAVLPHDDVHHRYRYKSNNKTLTCWGLKLPVVKHPEDLERLATASARETEANKRYTEVYSDWHVELSGRELVELATKLQSERR